MPEKVDLESLTRRLERLEEGLSLLLLERHPGDATADLSTLRASVRSALPALSKEVRGRVRDRRLDTTPVIQWTGENLAAVVEFCGSSATVREDDGSPAVLWLICRGHSSRLRAGSWLAKDSGHVRPTSSPFDRQEATA